MKKIVALLLVLVVVFSFAACGAKEETYEIALVTDVGNIDDKSFNEGAWNGVKNYAEANGKTYNYYRPSEDSTAARLESIATAVEKGAKVVVCPGFLFEDTVYEAQTLYPEVMFLILDGEPHTADYSVYETKANTSCILYQEEQAGFFAGYAAVADGYRNLGFIGGMNVPAVTRFGYGFIQGADYAAKVLGLNEGDVTVKFWYSGLFVPSDETKVKADGWYTEGTEVIFACGGSLYQSVVAAADAADTKVIGVDSDQSNLSDKIITSAMKDLTASVELALAALYDNGGTWPEGYAGVTSVLGADDNCVGIPTAEASWKFNTYTVAEYEVLFDLVKNGEVTVSNAIDTVPATTYVTVDVQ